MKSLIVLRHAKTERDNPGGDHARELTARGRRDAESAAGILASDLAPDLLLSSSAVRAIQTMEIVNDVLGGDVDTLRNPAIYLASLDELIDVLHTLPESADRVLLVGHNPGFLELINWFLRPEDAREHLPTAAFAVVESEFGQWTDLNGPDGVTVSPTVAP